MKDLYNINKWSVITTIILCFTFWGGIIALPVLGIIQIGMSLRIIDSFSELNTSNKTLFIIYSIFTVSLIILFKKINVDQLLLMFIWAFVSIGLACFHLYIIYKIYKL